RTLCFFHQLRLIDQASVGYGRGHLGHLQRGGQVIALANGDRQGLPFVPGLVVTGLFPFAGGHQPGHLFIQMQAAGLSQAEAAAPLGNAVNPQPLPHVIKIDVAGFHQGPLEIDLAVAALFPAFELVVAADQGPGAIKGGFGVMTFSSRPATAMIILKVAPGGYCPRKARFSRRWLLSWLSRCHSWGGSPRSKASWEKVGEETMARILPERGSRATMAPALPSRQSSASCCMRLSKVRQTLAPGVGEIES